jgi:hypothetical protein
MIMNTAVPANRIESTGSVVASNDSTSTDALVSRITAVRLSLRPSEQRVAAMCACQPNRVAHMAHRRIGGGGRRD